MGTRTRVTGPELDEFLEAQGGQVSELKIPKGPRLPHFEFYYQEPYHVLIVIGENSSHPSSSGRERTATFKYAQNILFLKSALKRNYCARV